ncbi:MAG: FeoA family protein [Candidatus Omnitrophica bacterium]|nr:FeoA family protein [Candidatus Omnitrophota bacterium]MDD5081265.1 FeoA family protein [Candidatus Omnitrophota bacterium]MDD5441390.1 FeoA family protein [Candidatus Omnitrophota bacterium]
MSSLSKIQQGNTVIFISVNGGRAVMKKLMDMGLIPGSPVTVINNPGNGPVSIMIKGSKIAIGYELAKKIMVRSK